jgi:hypothetical protein
LTWRPPGPREARERLDPRRSSDPAARAAAHDARLVQPEHHAHRRLEAWAIVAWLIGAAFLALLVYLGVRPGGRGPVLAYTFGRDLIMLLALITFLVGLAWSALHRPFLQRRRMLPFACLVGVIGVAEYPLPYPSSHDGHPSAVCMHLPVDGEWTVFWGGETKDESLLAGYFADRRWGLDLVITKNGMSHDGDGLAARDYYAYDQPVTAPAAGVVAHVSDRAPEMRPGEYDSRVEAFGNYIVLEVAPGEFVFLCHLKQGSIRVHEGERVNVGDPIGHVGSSGYSTATNQPHLALHMQDTPIAGRGEAVPWAFCDYTADGMRVERGLPRGGLAHDGTFLGQRVQALPLPGR